MDLQPLEGAPDFAKLTAHLGVEEVLVGKSGVVYVFTKHRDTSQFLHNLRVLAKAVFPGRRIALGIAQGL